ncbi:DUF2190 domain-containing protein [Parasedimentitalea marina]|uniref:DUF2190 domain-containing protein n=1 Tax=Parasedimentitalea marina TaxID=2483033 RepID=A0A3T0N1R9_9RHOB|nr:DUF2190 family protein [Parasedimentitalea marina]AZV77939.1 DUF2190 domain-containing protein [Parasedimentitalea marina]
MIPTFIRAYPAGAAVAGYRIVMFSDAASSNTITQADSNTASSLGVSDAMGSELDGMCDVHRDGLVHVELGGTVAAGDPLTSDGEGKAIAAIAATATTIRIVGFADEPGVTGDVIDAFLSPALLHEA